MLRALFLREFRKSWLAHAGLLAAVFGAVTLLEHAVSREGPLNSEEKFFLSLASVVISGLISGERCFSKAFKEGRYPFLLTLPRRRSRILLSYLGGRLAGALAALPVLLLRWLSSPPAVKTIWPLLISALAVYIVYFLGGAALALALQKEILVYLFGFPLLTALILLLAYSASYGFAPIEEFYSWQENLVYLLDVSIGSLLLALMWTALVRRAFYRGELHLGKRTAQSLAEAGLASATFAGLAMIAFSSTSLAAFRDEWQLPHQNIDSGSSYLAGTRPVSADGRYLFIYQQLQKRPIFTSLAVVDLKNGTLSGWMKRPAIHQAFWSTSGAVLNVLATNDAPSDCLSLPCEGSTSWYRLSPDLRVMSVRKFPGLGLLHQLGSALLLVTRQGSVGRIYRLSDQNGGFRKVLTSELDNDPRVWSLDTGAVVVFPSAASLHAWWLDHEGQLRHQASMKQGSEERYYIVGHHILSFQEVKTEIIRRAFPPPSTNLDIGEPLLPGSGPLVFGSSQFFLQLRGKAMDIWKHDSRRGDWTRLLSEYKLSESTLAINSWESVPLAISGIDFQTGTLAAVVASGGRDRLFLYNDKLGRSIPNSVSCSENQAGMVELNRVQGLRGLLVRYTCLGQRERHWLLNLVPGSGQIEDLPTHAAEVPPYLFDRWIYLDPDGISVWVSTGGEVWQAGPEHKSRRLNPPERS
jgi:hypothetical protein